VKSGGLLIAAHILKSRHYSAGKGTRFPSVYLEFDDVVATYRRYGDFEFRKVLHPGDAIRQGYEGMAVIVGHV
jgi:hypothetical protein